VASSDETPVSSLFRSGDVLIVEERSQASHVVAPPYQASQEYMSFPVKLLLNQFFRRYQVLGVPSASITDITNFLNKSNSNSSNGNTQCWGCDGVRLFMKEEIMNKLEEARRKAVPNDPHRISDVEQSSTTTIGKPTFHSTVVLLLSGKRCSGKDTVAIEIKKIAEQHDTDCVITHFTDEFKRLYCEKFNLDFHRILIDREYKEAHRDEMTRYYAQLSHEGFSFITSLAEKVHRDCIAGFTRKRFYVIPDLRDLGGIKTFQNLRQTLPHLKVILIRINIKDEARAKRGWIQANIDFDPTETALDDYDDWDLAFNNSKDGLEHCQQWVNTQVWPLVSVFL